VVVGQLEKSTSAISYIPLRTDNGSHIYCNAVNNPRSSPLQSDSFELNILCKYEFYFLCYCHKVKNYEIIIWKTKQVIREFGIAYICLCLCLKNIIRCCSTCKLLKLNIRFH
jgi:hypothetical protein